MKNLQIIAPEWANAGNTREWQATYRVVAADNTHMVIIESRSAIDIVIAKIMDHNSILDSYMRYFVSSPNYGIAIPWIDSLRQTNWITERLIAAGMPTPDAITVAQVLREVGDF